MKDFMLIFIGKEYTDLGMSPEEMQQRMGNWFEWSEKMNANKVEHDGHALHGNVRRINGENRTITDLASADVKELVGGYYIIKAKDLDAATEIAKDFPDYDLGSTCEVREVMVFDQ